MIVSWECEVQVVRLEGPGGPSGPGHTVRGPWTKPCSTMLNRGQILHQGNLGGEHPHIYWSRSEPPSSVIRKWTGRLFSAMGSC